MISQSFTMLPQEASRYLPSAENFTLLTWHPGKEISRTFLRVLIDQIIIFPPPPEARNFPSGENERQNSCCLKSSKVFISEPPTSIHILTVPSMAAVANIFPDGEKATASAGEPCMTVKSAAPEFKSHTFTVPVRSHEAM